MTIDTAYDIGDVFIIDSMWRAVCVSILVRASGQLEYQLEWLGDAEFKSEWITADRMKILGIEKEHNSKGLKYVKQTQIGAYKET